ncbi:MAG: stage II sporulation protein D [Bacilli bacterium]|nr:stage II sporulation protein D [Bacilli bacterium]
MKKVTTLTILIVLIPFFVTKIFTKKEIIKFNYIKNSLIKVKDEKTNKIMEIPLEEYIKGVVSAEMGPNFEEEALKAQAVASRSYALYHMNGKEYDVTNTTSNQVYLTPEELKERWKNSYPKNINKIKKAVEETKGEYLIYNGEVANTLFFASSPGQTENSEEVFISKVPYLRSVSSVWDEGLFIDTTSLDLKEFYQKLELPYNDSLNIEILEKTSTGRIKVLRINNIEIKGRDFSQKLNLKSNYFEITKNENKITIITKGYGHGVGLSQYGANGMAKEGKKYKEILSHYYVETEIKKM